MKCPKLYTLLEFPLIYSISQKLLAPGAVFLLKKHYKNIFGESRGRVLDVGCGPLLTTPLPNGIIVGIDINPLYVKRYTDQRTRYALIGSADFLPFDDNIFDEGRCVGLLHHLPIESAQRIIEEMVRCTRPEGKIIILDNVWPRSFYRPIAWLTRRFDRGEWVRTEEELLNLANTAYPGNWHHRRFTYSFTGLECLLLIIEKTK